jgi:ribosomal protein S18 acetylase RimI-like enzyme
MKIARLSQVSHPTVHAAFLRAFSDYQIPVTETLEEMAVENRQRGIDYDASFGAFADNGELVGFLFCGVRNEDGALRYYDGGTAIIPEWRGRGIGGLLLDTVLPDAKSRGAYDFILEVIQDNVNARKLYESRGFSISRNLRCYRKSLEDIPAKNSFSYIMHTPSMDEYIEVSKSLSLPYIPSWQNTNSSVLSIFEHLITRVLIQGGKPVGYFVLNPQTGHLLLMSALEGSPSIYCELLSLVRACTMADSVKFINIDESSTFITFLEEDGWDRYLDQYEMIKSFKPTT